MEENKRIAFNMDARNVYPFRFGSYCNTFREGDEKTLGIKVNDNYFGKISANRLKVTGNHIFLKSRRQKQG